MYKVDERDTMFARAEYKVGSFAYNDYYSKHPDKKDIDDSIRSRPDLCEEGTMTYNQINSPMASSAFKFLGDIKHLCEGPTSDVKVPVNSKTMTKRIKGFAKQYGACIVGITRLQDYHIYTHQGINEEIYGKEVKLNHKYAIVFGCELDKDMLNRSPMICEIIETSTAYVNCSIIGMILSYYIRSLGYDARNHIDSNYLVMPVLIAKDAGLGDIGRNSILTNKEYGSRLKLGVVTTDLPLEEDEYVDFGLEDFCNLCKKCSFNCPSNSLNNDAKFKENGDYNWAVERESCYIKWRYLGTDCGMCISACPFSQDLDTIKNTTSFKDNEELIKKALDEYKSKFGKRIFVPGNPPWLR
ncbi:4Fe-4S dicluster domain-containing protein [Romboutsia maritimum]|nr:reductive dehalogenase domain-containing protein [Romboutsia maritimum]